jgi:hypothetical protein
MKKTGRPKGTTIPASFAEEIKRARKTSPHHPQILGKVKHAHGDEDGVLRYDEVHEP